MSARRIARRGRIYAGAAVLVVAALAAAWLLWARSVIFHPTVAEPHGADAIVVLGPWLAPRMAQAEQLAATLHIDHIVLSVGDTPGQEAGVCPAPHPRSSAPLQVSCFVPDPYDTRGEAREIGSLARERGWSRMLVIAQYVQISRARLLISRCFGGELQLVPAVGTVGQGGVYDLLHQTGGFIKAEVFRGC